MTGDRWVRPAAWICAGLTALAFLAGAPGWTALYFLLLAPLYLRMAPTLFAPVTAAHMLAIIAGLEMGGTGELVFLVVTTSVSWAAISILWLRHGGIADSSAPGAAWLWWYALGFAASFLAVLLDGPPLWFAIAWCAFAGAVWCSLWTAGAGRRVARRAGILAAAGLCIVMVAELGSRVFVTPKYPMIQFVELHPEYFKTNRPHSHARLPVLVNYQQYKWVETAFSSQGLRDREYGPKEPGEFRIALLGDLHVLGHATSMEESLPRQLERVLSERLGHDRIRVINAGLAGSSVWEQHGFLRDRVLPLEPDLILHGLQPGSGIGYSLLRDEIYLSSVAELQQYRTLYYMNQDRWPVRLHFALSAWSHAYLSACGVVLPNSGLIPIAERLRFVAPLRKPAEPEISGRNQALETSLVEWYPEIAQGFENMKDEILAVDSHCEELGLPYTSFCIPQLISLSEGYFNAIRQETDPHSDYDPRKLVRKTHAFLEAADLDWIDLEEGMRAHPEPLSLYYPYDGHFTAEGCRVVAELLADALLAEHAALPRAGS